MKLDIGRTAILAFCFSFELLRSASTSILIEVSDKALYRPLYQSTPSNCRYFIVSYRLRRLTRLFLSRTRRGAKFEEFGLTMLYGSPFAKSRYPIGLAAINSVSIGSFDISRNCPIKPSTLIFTTGRHFHNFFFCFFFRDPG